jgi:G8 domain/FG-GAP-like repeat
MSANGERRVHVAGVAFVALLAALRTTMAAATTLPENIQDFSLDPSRPSIQTAQSGPWSSAATWQGGQVPAANHVVRILSNHIVTIDDTLAVAQTVAVDGKLTFAVTRNTRLKVTNLMVMAGELGMGTRGVLEIGTVAAPVAAGVTAEIVVANTSLGGGVADPLQFGTGVIVLGQMIVHGSPRTPTFLRLAAEPRAGNSTLSLAEGVSGWRTGDRIVLPDTRHIKESDVIRDNPWLNAVNQWEERTVAGISADGKTLTLSSPLQFDHLGARDLDGKLDFLPHVGNLTRNVVIRSENANGTRGHVLMTHLANVDVRYALFKDLGRTKYLPLNATTNAIGRYPVHVHHLSGPLPTPANGYQFTVLGNAVDGGSTETQFKWGIAVHGSHYGLIRDNVVYNYNGAAIATEDGSESFNVFDHNFALRGMGEPNDVVSEARMALGTEGVGFWFRGPNNFVKNNVAANFQNSTTEAAYGFVYQFRFLGDILVPNFKGAHDMPGAPTSQFTQNDGNAMPILQFENNEAYGAMQGGFTAWWVSSLDPEPAPNAKESIIKNLKLWHVYNKTVYMYPAQKVVFDGLIIRGNFDPDESRCCGNGVYFADYSSKDIVIRNSDIQGMDEGITAPEAGRGPGPNLTVLNSYLRNISNLDVPTNGSVNGCWMDPKLVVAINTKFAAPPGFTLDSVSMVRDVASAPECLQVPNQLRVYAYNGVATDNFQVYHSNAVVSPRPPAGCTNNPHAGIDEVVCSIAPIGPIPTASAFASAETVLAGQTATLAWNTTNASTVTIDHGVGTVAAAGTITISPAATTTYTVTATNATASVTAAATIMVTALPPLPTVPIPTPLPPLPTVTFTAAPAAIGPGGGSTLTWSSTNATTVSITPGIGVVGVSGTVPVSPVSTTMYALTATNAAGSVTVTASVAVSSGAGVPANVGSKDGDFDGDGRADIGIFRPSSGGWFIILSRTQTSLAPTWGVEGDIPVPGDFDGDGKADVAIFRPSAGAWLIITSSTGAAVSLIFGGNGDIPVPGDYDGDRKTDIAVFRPSTGSWYLGTGGAYTFGGTGDVPVPADFNGDGRTDIAVFRPSTGTWYLGTGGAYTFGGNGDVPVVGDYNGDGKADIAVFRPSTSTWYIGTGGSYVWGGSGDIPVVADYDGDGKTDVAVFRPSSGAWYVIRSSNLPGLDYIWGGQGDIPISMR